MFKQNKFLFIKIIINIVLSGIILFSLTGCVTTGDRWMRQQEKRNPTYTDIIFLRSDVTSAEVDEFKQFLHDNYKVSCKFLTSEEASATDDGTAFYTIYSCDPNTGKHFPELLVTIRQNDGAIDFTMNIQDTDEFKKVGAKNKDGDYLPISGGKKYNY